MSKQKKEVTIIAGDYSAQKKDSLLARCEKKRSDYDGFLHAGIIHYIQGNVPDFTLKAAISRILDKCPSIWPENLPEIIKAGKEPKITKAIEKEWQELNKNLIIPIQGGEIVEIIRLAKEFLKGQEESDKGKGE